MSEELPPVWTCTASAGCKRCKTYLTTSVCEYLNKHETYNEEIERNFRVAPHYHTNTGRGVLQNPQCAVTGLLLLLRSTAEKS